MDDFGARADRAIHLKSIPRDSPTDHHEARIVAIEDSGAESQSRLIVPFTVNNNDLKLEAAIQSQRRFLRINAAGYFWPARALRAIHVYHHRQPLGIINRSMGQMTIDTTTMGRGPVRLTGDRRHCRTRKQAKRFSRLRLSSRFVRSASSRQRRRDHGVPQPKMANRP